VARSDADGACDDGRGPPKTRKVLNLPGMVEFSKSFQEFPSVLSVFVFILTK
jgi:hypothetical protein